MQDAGEETFTQAAHFKKLARILRESGHKEIPDTLVIADEVKKTNNVEFTQWFMEASSGATFTTLLSFHMTRRKRRAREVTM
jgi:hypothetical protein